MQLKDVSARNKLFRESTDKGLWKTIRDDAAYAGFRKDLEGAWEQAEKNPLTPLTFDLFMVYENTGSRWEYEQEYFARRLVLNSSFMCYMIYGDEKYLKKLENIIMIICDEYTWAIPACGAADVTDCEKVSI